MAYLNTKTIYGGVGDILAVDGGVGGSAIQIRDGNGTATPLWLSTSSLGIGITPSAELEVASATNADIILTRAENSITVGESVGQLSWRMVDADGATDSNITAGIKVLATETHGASTYGSDMYFMAANATGTSGLSTIMKLEGDGNVGIGTDSPAAYLHVNQTTDLGGSVGDTQNFLQLSGDTDHNDNLSASLVRISTANTDQWTSAQWRIQRKIDSTFSSWISFGGEEGSGLNNHAISFGVGSGSDILDPNEAMRIQDDGKVGIGTASPTSTLHVSKELVDDATLAHFEYHTDDNAVDANDTIIVLEFGDDNSEAGTPYFIRFQDSDSVMAHIKWDDDNSAVFTDVSDYRIKSNIEPMSGSLVDLNKLKPSSFNIREASKKAYGFIAHELAEVYPSMVTGEKDAVDEDGKILPQSIAQSKLIPFMIKAIQELSAKVTALENA